jgi:hypothetical protein
LFNPTIDQGLIAAARISDPQAALSEWDGEFRSDLAAFLDDATIEIAIDRDRPLELPPQDGVTYYAFADASAGRHDAFTLCIVHQERERVVADLVCGRPAPFDPATVAAEYAALAKKYHCQSITGDNFAGEWTVNAFTTAGIEYRRSQLTKSELYLEGLPWFSRGLVSIPDSQVLLRELRLLERRVARSGKDSVDHGPSGNDDYSNALFGGINLATRREFEPPLVAPVIVVTKRECFGDSTYTGGFTTDRSPVHLPLSPRSFP